MQNQLSSLLILVCSNCLAFQGDERKLFNSSLEELLDMEIVSDKEGDSGFSIYGFVSPVSFEQVFNIPHLDEFGETETESDPLEYGDMSGFFYGSVRYKNIEGKIELFASNHEARLEAASIKYFFGSANQYSLAAGKFFRKFDLYNETLNHFIVFSGIEAPELFDGDHTIPRFANLSFHWEKGPWQAYFDMGQPESGAEKDVIPVGWDFRYEQGKWLIGSSGYFSSLTQKGTSSSVAPGEGSPEGGVLPWMSEDRYAVVGAFIQRESRGFLIESAFWSAKHSGVRDPESVLLTERNTFLNERQLFNFFGQNAGKPSGEYTAEDVLQDADYTVNTGYLRLGYAKSEFVYYAHWDWMDHPETISDKKWGGDNEAGFSDDGTFTKWSVGIIWRPNSNIAIKLDGSVHTQDFNQASTSYPEVRAQGSWAFKAGPWN